MKTVQIQIETTVAWCGTLITGDFSMSQLVDNRKPELPNLTEVTAKKRLELSPLKLLNQKLQKQDKEQCQ